MVLVDRNCHKSHHYALMLGGAQVTYLDSYPLDQYSMYGAVPWRPSRDACGTTAGRTAGQVKMLSLTNCTFDGIVYDVERVMNECLAIKPDLVFLWDEAWFAFAGFHPIYRRRTAMAAARAGCSATAAPVRQGVRRSASERGGRDEAAHAAGPRRVRVRVYATQSTHKTLTSLRQGQRWTSST